MLDEAGNITSWNNAAELNFGYDSDDVIGKSFSLLMPEELRPGQDELFARLKEKKLPTRLEAFVKSKKAGLIPVGASFSLMTDKQGKTLGFSAIIRDMTERKRMEEEIHQLNTLLERRVIERTAELESANKELEAFSYSVSHDLRAPLRAIDGFTRILLEDHAPRLDDEGRRVCGIISGNTRRMSEIIDALLAFSHLGRTEIRLAPVDMTALVGAVFAELSAPEERTRIDFHLDQLPEAVGDPTLLRQVWVNLLGNAIKFSARKERATISVSALSEGDEIVYTVRDNGAGFNMAYANKLFGVFQRLHSDKEFAGTGLGLALVQRIVERHGGRVWAEGEPDRGATFYFTLGAARKE